MSQIKTIGISTGGGDCPGLNAVIRAAVKSAILQHQWKVLGITDGYDGLLDPPRLLPLTLADVSGILPRGGTILGTTNRGNPFSYKTCEGGVEKMTDISGQVLRNARALGIDAVINIGGDGTQRIGLGLYEKGLPLVGVPKTIDNDLMATDSTFGFDTAVHTATDAIDKLHSTAESHKRIMLVEVMGRDAGWIALHAGLAGGAHIILIPEIPFTIAQLREDIRAREHSGKRFSIIAVAEGVKLPSDLQEYLSPSGGQSLAAQIHACGISRVLGEAISNATHREVRVTVLGHTQRGGTPTPFDRNLSTRFGVAAVQLLAEGKFGQMVALRGTEIVSVPLTAACAKQKLIVPSPKGSLVSPRELGGLPTSSVTPAPGSEMVAAARAVGISFGD